VSQYTETSFSCFVAKADQVSLINPVPDDTEDDDDLTTRRLLQDTTDDDADQTTDDSTSTTDSTDDSTTSDSTTDDSSTDASTSSTDDSTSSSSADDSSDDDTTTSTDDVTDDTTTDDEEVEEVVPLYTYLGSHGLKRFTYNTTSGHDWDILEDREYHTSLVTTFELPQHNRNQGTDYSDYMTNVFKGWFIPPATTKYRFYQVCDDKCILKLGNVSG